jgi:hypothetical protein
MFCLPCKTRDWYAAAQKLPRRLGIERADTALRPRPGHCDVGARLFKHALTIGGGTYRRISPRDVQAAQQYQQEVAIGSKGLTLGLIVQKAATDAAIEASFGAFVKGGADALMVRNDPFFDSRRRQIVALSSQHQLPGIFISANFPWMVV